MLTLIVYMVGLFLAPTQAARGTIEHYSAVRVAEQTQTGTSTNWAAVTGTANTGTTASANGWIDSSNLTAGEDYLVMVWGEHSTNNTAGRSGIRVVRGGTPTAFAESQAIEETDNTGAAFKTPYFWFTVWTAVADEDLEVQFYNDLNTHTAAVEDVTLVVMNAEDLVANSELIYDIDTGGGTNSTTFTMRSSITWTPANANDTWWVGGYIKHDQAGTADQAEGRFDLNAGTIRALHSIEGEDANDTPLYGIGWAQQFAASSQTIEVETREDAAVSGGSEWDATGVFALRLNGFETFKAYGVAGDGTALTANNTYVEQGNVDHQQLSEGNYLVAAGAVVDDNGGVVNSKLTLADTDITDPTGGYSHNNADTIPTTVADMQIDSSLGLKDLDFDAQRTSATQAELQDRWVVAFSMERAGPPAELSIDGYIFENDDAITTGASYGGLGAGGTEDVTVSADVDLGTADESQLTLFSAFGDTWLGDEGENQNTWIRFAGVDIPNGATITNAYISFPDTTINDSGDVQSNIYAVDEDDHAAPTTYGEWTTDNGMLTTAFVAWDFTVTASPLQTPDISSVVQEIIDRGGWATGNDIGIQLNDDGTSLAVQAFDSYPTLHIEYDGGGGDTLVESTGTPGRIDLTDWDNSTGDSITVPADADFIIVGASGWEDGTNPYFDNGDDQQAYVSLNGTNLTYIDGQEDPTVNLTALWYMTAPPTGSQTLAWEWGEFSAPDEGVSVFYAFYKGVDQTTPIRDFASDGPPQASSATTGVMTAVDGDMVVGVSAGNGSGVSWTGATELFDATFNSNLASFAEESLTADVTLSVTMTDFAAITGVVIAAASGGGNQIEAIFPEYLETTTTMSTNFGTGNVDYPATVDAGDLMILVYTGSDGVTSVGNGFSSIKQISYGSGYSFDVFVDSAAGNEDGGTVSVTLDTSANLAHFHMIRVAAGTWEGSVGTAVDVSTGATGTSTTPDPDTVTASWGTKKNLFIAAAGISEEDGFTTAPTNYINLNDTDDTINSSLATATRELELDSDNPGTFAFAGTSDTWAAATIVVEPVDNGAAVDGGDDMGSVEGGTQQAGSEFSSGQTPTEVRVGERMNLRVHLTNSGGTLTDLNELALFYDRGDGIWSKARENMPPLLTSGGGCDDSAWTCEIVDSADDVGRHSSMAIDRLGHPWISYYDTTNQSLEIARFVGRDGSGCALASWACVTIDSSTDAGEYSSIAVGNAQDVWVSYWDDGSDDLKVANFVGAGGNCDDLYSGSDAWNCTIVDSTGAVGEYSSITLDRFGAPWVSYYDRTNTQLKVAEYVGSGGSGCASSAWTCTVVDTNNDVGSHSAIAFDNSGKPWVSYRDETGDDLKVANFVGGGGSCSSTTWNCSTINSNNSSGLYTAIAFDPLGRAWVSHHEDSAGDMRVSRYVGSGGDCTNTAWECDTIDSTNSVGSNTSIAFDPAGAAWVSYRDASNNTLRLARFVGSGGSGCAESSWACSAVESVTSAANGVTSLAFDTSGLAWISHFDETNDNLVVSYYDARAGEITISRSQDLLNGAAITTSRADMTSVTDTSNRDSADCVATATWNDGQYFEGEGGPGIELPNGLGADQCTEVMWTIDTAQATPGTTYRFIVATADNFQADNGMWRGPIAVNDYPTLTMARDEDSVYRYGKDRIPTLPNCNVDTAWGCSNVDATNGGGQYTSTGFDPDGNPWMSYYENIGGDLKVARYVGSGGSGCASEAWHCMTLDSEDDVGLYTSLAFDSEGMPWVSYYDATSDNLKVARYVGAGGTGCDLASWSCGIVDSAGNTGQYTSIGFDASGRTWITYYDASSADLDTARYVGTAGVGCDDIAWTCSTIESEDDIGSHSSLAFDHSGVPWVSYYDATADDLKIARYTGLGNMSTCGSGSGVSGPPTVQTTATDTQATTGTFAVNLPSGIQAGDMLIFLSANEAGSDFNYTPPSGYVELGEFEDSNDAGGMVAYRYADGTEGSTVNWTTSSAEDANSAWIAYRISGAEDPGTQAPEMGTAAIGTSANPNPPNFVPTGTPKDILYIAMMGAENSADVTAFPTGTGYGNGQEVAISGALVGSAEKQESASTGDDPGTFTIDTSTFSWVAQTIAIHPGSGGSGGGESNWDCTTVDATDDVGLYSSLAFDASNNAWISYYDNTGGNLEVATYTGGSGNCDSVGAGSDDWNCTTVDSTDNVGRFTSIGFDATGAAWVSYFDFTNTNLNAARYVSSGGDCNSTAWDCMNIAGGVGATPTVTSITETSFGTDTTAHASTIPTTADGDRLIAFFVNDGGATVTTPTGWTLLDSGVRATNQVRLSIYYRDTDGSDSGGTVDFVTSATEQAATQIYRIAAGEFDPLTPPDITTTEVTGTNSSPDPASLNPAGWDVENTLWLAAAGIDNDAGTADISAYPASFTNGTFTQSQTGSNAVGIGTARRANAVSSEDPGTFTMGASEGWLAYTLAIRPASGACLCQYTGIAFDASGTPWISAQAGTANSLFISHLHMPPTKPTKNIVIPYATRSALSSDARYRLHAGLSPSTNPYGTCGATADQHGYCGLYHHEGYVDSMPAQAEERPVYSLATRFSTNTQLPTALAVFKSTVAPNVENVILQVYRFGSTNAWETVSTYNSAGCTTDMCSIRAHPSGTPSDYYETDGSNYWVYFRVYQTETSGELTFMLDHFTAEQTAKFLRGGRVFRESQTDPLGW